MARTCFLILFLLNLLMLAWIYISGDARINAGREPQRALAQIAPEKVRVVDLPADNQAQAICLAFAAPVPSAQDAARAFVRALPAARIVVTSIPAAPTFEIVVAGIKKRALAESSLADMHSLGLASNGSIRAQGENEFAIVIATYTERAVAEQAQRDLAAKGLRLATIAERPPAEARALIEVRGSEAALQTLPTLASNFKALVAASCTP